MNYENLDLTVMSQHKNCERQKINRADIVTNHESTYFVGEERLIYIKRLDENRRT